MGGCQRSPRNRKTAQNSAKTARPHRKIAKNRNTRILSNTTLILLFLPRKSYADLKMEGREGIGDASAFFMALKTPQMFRNDRNRKTATQNDQKPKNRIRFWWENANRKLLLKPQNRTKNSQKPQNRTKK